MGKESPVRLKQMGLAVSLRSTSVVESKPTTYRSPGASAATSRCPTGKSSSCVTIYKCNRSPNSKFRLVKVKSNN